MKAYVLPFILYLGFIQVPAAYPDQYGWLYPATVALVAAVTIGLLRGHRLVGPHWNVLAGVSVGLIGIALWIGLCRLNLDQLVAAYLHCGLQAKRNAFKPFKIIRQP